MTCSLNGKTRFGVDIMSPLESNGAIPVNVQDQTTKPLDSVFSQAISNFTLASDTGISTVTTLVYDFEAAGGHGIAQDDELLLLDPADNRVLQCVVLAVAVNTITIDRPIDHVFPAASTLGRIVTTNFIVCRPGSSDPWSCFSNYQQFSENSIQLQDRWRYRAIRLRYQIRRPSTCRGIWDVNQTDIWGAR